MRNCTAVAALIAAGVIKSSLADQAYLALQSVQSRTPSPSTKERPTPNKEPQEHSDRAPQDAGAPWDEALPDFKEELVEEHESARPFRGKPKATGRIRELFGIGTDQVALLGTSRSGSLPSWSTPTGACAS
eukprot:TRINITY_DN39087_c0_g1_i4.p1 TRINITY_DN39087_c0_g1~~TRINITY_DN39087_c0_g1_i4.p1  ORF type:complete len:131 (+),score=14.85 TRINITY_DN39087_c0_g1_i4:84-476(+)